MASAVSNFQTLFENSRENSQPRDRIALANLITLEMGQMSSEDCQLNNCVYNSGLCDGGATVCVCPTGFYGADCSMSESSVADYDTLREQIYEDLVYFREIETVQETKEQIVKSLNNLIESGDLLLSSTQFENQMT
jgi:coenzyme F420-reducing hydrogenase gamma subunit